MVKKILLFVILPIVVIFALFTSASVFYANAHDGEIYPGVRIGPVDVGGMTHTQAAAKLSNQTYEAIKNGLVLATEEGKTVTIPLVHENTDNPDISFDLITWNIDDTVSEAMKIGREQNAFFQIFTPILTGLFSHQIELQPLFVSTSILEEIQTALPDITIPAVNAAFSFSKNATDWSVTITPSVAGKMIDLSAVFNQMEESLTEDLSLSKIHLAVSVEEPEITEEEAITLVDKAKEILSFAPYTLSFTAIDDPTSWTISADELALLLEPVKDNEQNLFVQTNQEKTIDLLNEKLASILIEPRNARLVMENNRITEFEGSRTGIALDEEKMWATINEAIQNQNTEIDITVLENDPEITTAEVNDLGIKEVLGVGTSDFSRSPSNRIKNIQNGARLLNGILIAPHETFSLLSALRPFTLENGYLPELVIKGDKIEPEVGGGLCQIGTTTFRATMNSGLSVVERRNHSLVVSYYNDPKNNNPGTDATIYDPAPDFKFLNDTGHWILFETDVNTETSQLTFTFWGTSDGRIGSYTPPIVSNWIGAGEKKIIETTDLPAGQEKCQAAHNGANASFTYTVEKADGSKNDQLFTSSYRALPQICLVGVEKIIEEIPLKTEVGSEDSELSTDVPVEEPATTIE